MSTPLLKLTGTGEGIDITISTTLVGADSPAKVGEAITNIFPEFPVPEEQEPEFGSGINSQWSAKDVSLKEFLHLLHQQRILDTAMDVMSRNFNSGVTKFDISRQAALAGKVAFPLPDETPLGGVFTIELASDDLKDWIEAATWHNGRDMVPRSIADERAMAGDGEASTWV